MKSTEETIKEIEAIILDNTSIDVSARYAVLRPIKDYENVDFSVIANHFKTEKINSYTQSDKIVIEL